jgi:hypothetical protein
MSAKCFLAAEFGIKGGAFVREWSQEQAKGSTRLHALMGKALVHAITVVETESGRFKKHTQWMTD